MMATADFASPATAQRPAKNGARSLMRAAVVAEPRRLELHEVPIPEPGPGEVRVRLEGCGVCASNLPPWEGREWFSYPMEPGALGHEGWGRVDAVGAGVTEIKEGDRAGVLSLHAYADYDVAPVNSVAALPQELGDRVFPAEPLGCAINVFKRSGIQRDDVVAIIGVGFLGALLVQLASRAGARVFAISRRTYALEIARAMGANDIISMDDHWKIIERVKKLSGGRFCDVVIEAVGKQWPLDLVAELVRERGRLVIAGYHQDGPRQVNMQLWNWRGIDVINAHERDPQIYLDGMREAVQAVKARRLTPEVLYTHRFPLEQLDEALNTTRDRPEGFMKALVLM
jgi:threonine dehydrogenase-like Zn-dependent dehydrogenase